MFAIKNKGRKNYRVRLSDKSIAVPVYTEDELVKDPELWYAFKANIAVQFQDSAHWHRLEKENNYLNREDIHKISNEAAENFLKLWTQTN